MEKEVKEDVIDEVDELVDEEVIEEVVEEIEEVDKPEQDDLENERLELWNERIELRLEKAGLLEFRDFITVEVGDKELLESKINQLSEIVEGIKSQNTYVPTEHKSVDAYSIAKNKKDVIGMLKAKI